MFRSSDCLAVFAKQPIPGQVKTRLAAETSPAFAAQVAEAFLRDTLSKVADIPVQRFLVHSPREAGPYFATLAANRFYLEAQADGDLGTRMMCFLRRRFEPSPGRIVILGTDSPTMPVDFIYQAFRELERSPVVLGPATDGGYYLLGCAGIVPPIFEDIAWGGPLVLDQTIERLRQAGLRLGLLPPWYDVDTKDDWDAMRGHCRALRLAGFDPGLSHTESLFAI